MRVYLFSGVCFIISAICWRRAVANWRHFWNRRRQPLLAGITAARLAAIPIEWPLREKRWPPPWKHGSRSMDAEVADAYSRLAARIRRTTTIVADVLFIVGGAWLGVSLPDIWADYRQSADEATRALQRDEAPLLTDVTWSQFTHLLPAMLVAPGVGLLVLARVYEEAEHIYREAAVPDAKDVSLTTSGSTGSRSGVLRFLRRLLRNV
jgi:hypothetical protein